MRAYEFLPTIILETDVSGVTDLDGRKAIGELNSIISVAGQLPPEASNIKKKVAANLVALKDKVADTIAKFAKKTTQPIAKVPTTPVNTAPKPATPVSVDATKSTQPQDSANIGEAIGGDEEYESIVSSCEQLKQDIIDIENMSEIPERTKKQLIASMKTQLDNMYSMLSKYSGVVDELKTERQKREAAENFVKEVNKLLVELGNKVQGYTEISKEEFNVLSKRAQQIHVNAQNFTTTFRQALFSMILDISSQNQQVDKLAIQKFLEACVNGDVLDMLSLTNVDRGNVRDHVKEEYQPMIDLFAEQNVFSWKPGKTSGAVGPGEMALSMMGSPTEKAKEKGDLKVGSTMYEIKAGQSSGGRLNSKKILKGPAAWPVWKAGIEKIIKNGAPPDAKFKRHGIKGQEIILTPKNFSANTYNQRGTKWKEAAVYNFNPSGLKALNEQVLIYSDYDSTYELFYNTFSTLITNLDAVQKSTKDSEGNLVRGVSPEKLISSAINEDGTINPLQMLAAYTRLAYESYNRADGVEAILFLHTGTLDYTIIRNGRDFMSKLTGNQVRITSGFNFNDDQQSATPAYLATKSENPQ